MSHMDRRSVLAAGAVLASSAIARSASLGEMPVQPQTANLFLIKDLDEAGRTSRLAESDLTALRAVADWTNKFVVQPNHDLGRPGPVCPFTVRAIEQDALWLAAERSAGRSKADVIQLIGSYQQLLLANPPIDGDAAGNKSIVIVFTDLPAVRASDFLGAALEQIAMPSYVKDGLVMGPFYEGNAGTAIYNPNFRPFTSPVPLLLMRRAVISDWKFFLNDENWLRLWARRYGDAAVEALAGELRRLPWNARSDAHVLEGV